jgi:hypothetical protein
MSYIISYKNCDETYTIINSDDKNVEIVPSISSEIYKKRFVMLKGFEPSSAGLTLYQEKFEEWCKEIRERKQFFIDYKYYFNDGFAVYGVFNQCAKNTGHEDFEKIDFTELKWINKCNNGGLVYCQPGTYECYGYDFKMFYPRLLGSKMDSFKMQFPTKRGKDVKLKKLNFSKLKFGYYHCIISSEHKDASKLFSFSKHNVYTNYSIEFAHNQLEEYDFKIELVITEGLSNAYLYEDESLIYSHKIFNDWYYKLSCMRNDFPKNKLLKHLTSSLSGHLISYNVQSVNVNDITDEMEKTLCFYTPEMPSNAKKAIFKEVINDIHPEQSYYKIIDLENPMKYSLGRFKAFLMSVGRIYTANAAMIDLDNVVRIQTDGIVYKTKQNLNKQHFNIPKNFLYEDEKTTGNITFKNVNSYFKND